MSATNVMAAMEKQMQKWLEGEVGRLATQYKFNKSEALSYLRGEIERVEIDAALRRASAVSAAEKKTPKTAKPKTKPVKKSDKPDLPQPEVPLPYCGEGADDQCCGVVLNHQMFTQCTHRVSGEFTTEGDGDATTLNLCKGCFKSAGTRTKAGNKPLTYGTIAERLEKGGVIGNNGALRKPVTYANVMAKLGITEEQALSAAEKMGWTIPEEELHPQPVARGRPKKEKAAAVEVVADTSGSESENGDNKASKKRGRPKKEKKVLSAAGGEDLIANLVQEAQQNGVAAAATSDEEAGSGGSGSDTSAKSTVSKSDQKKQAASAKKEEAAAAKLARAAELVAKKAEKAAAVEAKKAEKAAEKAAAAEAKKAEKAAAAVGKALAAEEKKAAAAKKKEKSAPPPPVMDELEEEPEVEEDEEEATQVVKWTCPADNKEYLKSADNVVYDAESHEAVGVWNEKENKIDELPAEEGEDEDE
jgi:hypothetical protein